MKSLKRLGYISLYGTLTILSLIAFISDAYIPMFEYLKLLVTGRVLEIDRAPEQLLVIITVIFAAVSVAIMLKILILLFNKALLGKDSGNDVRDMMNEMKEGHHLYVLFVVVVIEELIVRWLLLGVFTKIEVLSGPAGFYWLFVIGNLSWALVHLLNFSNARDRNPIRALPQFVGGVFYTMIFVRYGLFYAILTHLISNAVLYTASKKQESSKYGLMVLGYASLVSVGSFMLLNRSLSDALIWFSEAPRFQLVGWTWWDHVLLTNIIGGALIAVGSLIQLDSFEAESSRKASVWVLLLCSPLNVAIVYAVYYFAGFIISDVHSRILLAAILLISMSESRSGSDVSRRLFVSVPTMFVMICCIESLGIAMSIPWFTAYAVVSLPMVYFMRRGEESFV